MMRLIASIPALQNKIINLSKNNNQLIPLYHPSLHLRYVGELTWH
jgi:hypothetical protein